MADDNPAINSGISLFRSLIIYRNQCQDQLARFLMLPPDYARYTQLTGNYVSDVLPYAEFRRQMLGLLGQNPNYTPLRVYWVDYDRFITQGISVSDSPLFNFPIFLNDKLGIPIPPENAAQLQDFRSELGYYYPEQSHILVTQEVRDLLLACQKELDCLEEWSRQQELARQQQIAGQQEMVRQQQMAGQQEMAWREDRVHGQYREEPLARFRATEEERRGKQREDRKNKIRRQGERE